MDKRLFILLLILIVFLTAFLYLTGCKSDYKTFTLQNGVGHFSLMYPSSYKVKNMNIYRSISLDYSDWASDSTHIFIGDPLLGEFDSPPVIGVAVGSWLGDIFDSGSDLDSRLERLKKDGYDFRLISREPVKVDGQWGEQIVYFYRDISAPMIVREAYFYYEGLYWRISMDSYEAAAEVDKKVYKYILKTFRFLDVDLEGSK